MSTVNIIIYNKISPLKCTHFLNSNIFCSLQQTPSTKSIKAGTCRGNPGIILSSDAVGQFTASTSLLRSLPIYISLQAKLGTLEIENGPIKPSVQVSRV